MEGGRGLTPASSRRAKTGEQKSGQQKLQMAVAAFHGSLQRYSSFRDTNTTIAAAV
jgi:hypothetical protein